MPSLDERVAYLEGRLEDHATSVGEFRAGLTARRADVHDLGERMDRRFEGLDGRIAEIDLKIDRHADSVDRRFTAIDGRFTAIDGRFTAIDERFAALDTRLAVRDQQVDGRFVRIEQKLDRHLIWIVGIQVAVFLAVISALVAPYFR